MSPKLNIIWKVDFTYLISKDLNVLILGICESMETGVSTCMLSGGYFSNADVIYVCYMQMCMWLIQMPSKLENPLLIICQTEVVLQVHKNIHTRCSV